MTRLTAIFLVTSAAGICFSQEKFEYASGMFAELPHERGKLHEGFAGVNFPVTTKDETAAKFFQQGLAELYAGTKFEAARAFREVITRDPDCAMGYWGIARAKRDDPSLATEYMWYAYEQRDKASVVETAIVSAYAEHFGVTTQPEMVIVDSETGKRRARPGKGLDDPIKRSRLQKRLNAISSQYSSIPEVRSIACFQDPEMQIDIATDSIPPIVLHLTADQERRMASRDPVPPVSDLSLRWIDCARQKNLVQGWFALGQRYFRIESEREAGPNHKAAAAFEAAIRLDHQWLKDNDALPYEREGYFDRWSFYDYVVASAEKRQRIYRSVRSAAKHPRGFNNTKRGALRDDFDVTSVPNDGRTKFLESLGPLEWTPPKAPAFALQKGKTDGIMTVDDFDGPTIVVFYLGFGCIHCVEQLNELRPRYKDFKDAGIEIVAIGTDKVDEVKAAILDTLEVDGPQTPFEILCDPTGETFKAYRCWDQFTDEALHGTFIVDAKGQILWRDISEEPFMETDFLLKEAKRLTK